MPLWATTESHCEHTRSETAPTKSCVSSATKLSAFCMLNHEQSISPFHSQKNIFQVFLFQLADQGTKKNKNDWPKALRKHWSGRWHCQALCTARKKQTQITYHKSLFCSMHNKLCSCSSLPGNNAPIGTYHVRQREVVEQQEKTCIIYFTLLQTNLWESN